jgi:serine/threonine-protein kinase RsbW
MFENLITKITVKTDKKLLSSIVAFVRNVAINEGLHIEDARKLELVTDEACLNVIDHAFEGQDGAYFDITLERRPAQFVISIEDKGLPFDWKTVDSGKGQGLGLTLMKAFSDEIKFLNLGKEGKRLELIKNFSYEEHPSIKEESETSLPEKTSDMAVTVRFMEGEEGVSLAKCFYHTYGYNYRDYIYYPEKMKEFLEKGLQKSVVSVTEDGEIAGHVGIAREKPDSHIAELIQCVVHPSYRNRGLFNKMMAKSIDYAKECNLYGLYNESVTVHPFSQKVNRTYGGQETGFLLASISERGIEEDPYRQSSIIYYFKINEEPERTVYIPLQHTTMIKNLYEHIKLRRKFEKPTRKATFDLPDHAMVDIKVIPDRKSAFMYISRYGPDLKDLVRVHLKELCLNKIECIYIDLPMNHPLTCNFCTTLEYLGFFFAGLIPELHDGDILRLQYLNNVTVDPEQTIIISPFGKELFKYIQKCQGEGGLVNLLKGAI